jgi:hypothetical protein
MTSAVFALTAATEPRPVLRTVRPSAGAFGVFARRPSGMARGHAASEHGSDLLLKARRAENESAIGCRADLVDDGLVQRPAEQGRRAGCRRSRNPPLLGTTVADLF